MQKQELSMLSLARKAGKLVLGFDKTADGLKDGTVKGLFYSADLSEKSKKELHFIGDRAFGAFGQHGGNLDGMRKTLRCDCLDR